MIAERCSGNWKVIVHPMLHKELKRGYPSDVVERFYRAIRELEEDLNGDPRAIFDLMREPIVDRTLSLRRFRIGKYRAWFVIVAEDCAVVFLGFGPRGKFYDRYRKRGL